MFVSFDGEWVLMGAEYSDLAHLRIQHGQGSTVAGVGSPT